MTEKVKYAKRYTVYMKDVPKFKKLRDEFKLLYYRRYGNSLHLSDIIEKAISMSLNVLKNEGYSIEGKKNLHKVEDVYGRIG